MRIAIIQCDLCGYIRDPREQTGRERSMISLLRKDGQSVEAVYVPLLKQTCDKHVCINCATMLHNTIEKGNTRGPELADEKTTT